MIVIKKEVSRMRAHKRIFILTATILLCFTNFKPAQAGWFNSDGNSFQECMENRRKDIKNNAQKQIAASYCREKFPDYNTYELPEYFAFNLLSQRHEYIETIAKNIEIKDVTYGHDGQDFGQGIKSPNYAPFIGLLVFNKNDYSVSGIIIGTTKNKSCTYDKDDYSGTYQCKGSANANASGLMKCYLVDSPKFIKEAQKEFEKGYCKVGILLYGTKSEFDNLVNSIDWKP